MDCHPASCCNCTLRTASAGVAPAASKRWMARKSSRASRSAIGCSVPMTSAAPACRNAPPRLGARDAEARGSRSESHAASTTTGACGHGSDAIARHATRCVPRSASEKSSAATPPLPSSRVCPLMCTTSASRDAAANAANVDAAPRSCTPSRYALAIDATSSLLSDNVAVPAFAPVGSAIETARVAAVPREVRCSDAALSARTRRTSSMRRLRQRGFVVVLADAQVELSGI